ncbi:MarR family transcriptional regulator [Amorphoplanes nipponensis]|uniref:Transcriptional regulator n=1 Tax=Actinoplanes nipponensis TaxID=135950 RepID=A0A919JI54_9ACTN|nr:MarR family transcriptional regulator [Actinoplanes nipponensis]GIE47229.1 transcriptional regulator [Actinoplanes nipponensis]
MDGVVKHQHRSAAEEEVVGALLATSRVFVGLAARSLGVVGEDVTLAQYRTLVVLVSRGPQRVVDLAQELAVTSSTATRMCNRLVRKGLVARRERADDRRAVWVTLTAAGRDLVGDVMRHRRTEIAALVSDLALTRPVAFASVLHALVEAAGEVPDAQWWRQWSASVPDEEEPPSSQN